MRKGDQVIEYRYLNMRTEKFCKSLADMQKQIKHYSVTKIICVPNYEHNQVLYAAGGPDDTECGAILMCRKLSGLNRTGEALH